MESLADPVLTFEALQKEHGHEHAVAEMLRVGYPVDCVEGVLAIERFRFATWLRSFGGSADMVSVLAILANSDARLMSQAAERS